MRPINLIPPEQRRGDSAPLRTGPVPYALLGVLVVLLVGVAALVLTNNQIGEGKSEVAKLENEDVAAAARAKQLSVYSRFQEKSEQRVLTVNELANSRFDWERVMRELALILPRDVWLVGLTATATPGASVAGGGGGGMRSQIAGPALEMTGCAKGQDGVAGFVTALKDIDGVTRVGVETSELGEKGKSEGGGSGGGGSSGGGSSSQCRTRDFIAEFQIVVAFDAAPVPPEEGGAPVSSPTEKAEATKESSEGGTTTTSSEGG